MSDTLEYLHAVLGDDAGYVRIGVGSQQYVKAGKYAHQTFTRPAFAWPDDADRVAQELVQASAAGDDVYVCPYVGISEKSEAGTAVARRLVHADVDGDVDVGRVREIGGFAVGSGTEGHGHVYVPLTESVPAHVHKALCRGIGAWLGDADAKISDNDLLRPPGTLNFKAPTFGRGDATPVTWLVEPPGTPWEPQKLAEVLGVTLPSGDAPTGNVAGEIEPVDVDRLPQYVRDKLAEVSGDRSTDTMGVVGACYHAGLTLAQSRGVVQLREDLVARLRERSDDDVLTCWIKATDSRQQPDTPSASTVSAGPSGSQERGRDTGHQSGPELLADVRAWLARFVCTIDESDLDLLTLWAAHTHLCVETYTTPRLVLDSPVPGSGKTTVLEHLERLCLHPVQMASLSSSALLTRMLDAGIRTVLIDEADRSLDPKNEGVGELLAVLNSGYKRGGTRPVLVPNKENGWTAKEMPTFSPVVMAGNQPNLPDDTRARAIRVLLMPDISGEAEESDWELHDETARELGDRLAAWADQVRDEVRATRPQLPETVRGRARERWAPLKRIAEAARNRWPEVVDTLAVRDVERIEIEREDGIVQQKPAVALLGHIHEVWNNDEMFVSTDELITRLVAVHPDMWGEFSTYGKRLTPQRLGRMLVSAYNVHADRPSTGERARGYSRSALASAFVRIGLDPSRKPDEPVEAAKPDEDEPESGQAPLPEIRASPEPGRATCAQCGGRLTSPLSLSEGICASCDGQVAS